MALEPIHLGRDPNRYECPRGHTCITSRQTDAAQAPYYCESCRCADYDPHWEASDLIDKQDRARTDDGGWNGV